MIKTGDIMLVQTNGWLARMIQRFQSIKDKVGGKYNHAGVFQVDEDGIYVIEAIDTGIEKTLFNPEYMQKNKYVSVIGLTPNFDTSTYDFVGTMKPYIGTTEYDFWDLLMKQAVRFVTGKWFFSKTIHTKHFICGEFVGIIYNKLNSDFFPNCYEIAPLDLYQADGFSHYNIK